jgi:hypothetical protein
LSKQEKKSFFELKKPCRDLFGSLEKGFLIFFRELKKYFHFFVLKKALTTRDFSKVPLKNNEIK